MIGERLAMLRKEKGLSMRAIGDIIGVSDTAWIKYEKNRAEPSISTLIKAADFFGVSLDFLMGRTNIRDPQIVTEANIQNDFLKSFEAASIGNTKNMYFLIENLAVSIEHYNEGKINEPELQLLIKTISEIILHFNTLVDHKIQSGQLNIEVLDEHKNTAAQIILHLNNMLELLYLQPNIKKNERK